ncbi:MAG TPA: RNA polymerase sigma-54 factor, partial [Phnomibacter sp.]|nr:RNA polymerase sigma-54 factor [Phnomibacter sp.]
MAISQGLSQVQKQQLRLLPQQIQLMKLLQVPTANLEERIKEELEENPALELGEEAEAAHEQDFEQDNEPGETYEEVADEEAAYEEEADAGFEYEELENTYYDPEDDIPDYQLRDTQYGEADTSRGNPIKLETNFHDSLVSQLGLLDLDEKMQRVAEQIVGSIDDDGYLRREVTSIVDDLAFRQNIETTDAEVAALLKRI